MRKLFFLLAAFLLLTAQTLPGFPPGVFQNRAALDGVAGPSYQGPGDIVSGALIWGSCARVYNASLASTATSLCDLVDTSVGSTAICTLRGSSTGFVDLTGTYCTGSATPATACAAAAGGACRVSKVYDQIGGTSGWVNATNSQRPVLTFSALHGLPGLTGVSASGTLLTTSSTFTQNAPWTWQGVAKRTANNTTLQAVIGASGGFNGGLLFAASTNTVEVTSDDVNFTTRGSVTDNSFHSLVGIVNGTSASVMAADGVETTGGNSGSTNMSASTSRIMRFAPGASMDGVWEEAGLWPSGFSSGQRTSMDSNVRSTNGYCASNGCTLP